MSAAEEDLATTERLIARVVEGIRADGLGQDPVVLLKTGRLRIALDAGRALLWRGEANEACLAARELLLDLDRAFPAYTNWKPTRDDMLLHRRYEAIGRAVLNEGAEL